MPTWIQCTKKLFAWWLAMVEQVLAIFSGDYHLATTEPRELLIKWSAMAWSGRAVAAGAALTFVVPVLSQVILAALPEDSAGPRVLFFTYEVLFFTLTTLLLVFHPIHQTTPWMRTVSRFVLVYYGLWATADAILLLTGSDLGFALRVVPNVLYYGGLIAVIGESAARGRS